MSGLGKGFQKKLNPFSGWPEAMSLLGRGGGGGPAPLRHRRGELSPALSPGAGLGMCSPTFAASPWAGCWGGTGWDGGMDAVGGLGICG